MKWKLMTLLIGTPALTTVPVIDYYAQTQNTHSKNLNAWGSVNLGSWGIQRQTKHVFEIGNSKSILNNLKEIELKNSWLEVYDYIDMRGQDQYFDLDRKIQFDQNTLNKSHIIFDTHLINENHSGLISINMEFEIDKNDILKVIFKGDFNFSRLVHSFSIKFYLGILNFN